MSEPKPEDQQLDNNCIFCQIANKFSTDSQLLYEDEKFVVIKDIRPAVEHHYLMITKKHIRNGRQLTTEEDIEMLKTMKEIGLKFISDKGLTDGSELRLGFHWPPFNTISHLHLHLLYPISQMSCISRIVYKPGSLWFVEINALIESLSKKFK